MPQSHEEQLLIKARKSLGVRQAYLARKTGIYRSKLSNWEQGKISLTKEELARVANLLGAVKPGEALVEDRGPGESTKKFREAHRVSQKYVAKKAGIAASDLSEFENGYLDLSAEAMERLEKVLTEISKTKQFKLSEQITAQKAELNRRQPSVQLRSLLPPEPGSLGDKQIKILEEQIGTMHEIIKIQDDLIMKGIDGPALVAEAGKKDVEIAALKQRVKDLMEMYDIGSQAVAATARYEELREKVQKPVVADDEEEPE